MSIDDWPRRWFAAAVAALVGLAAVLALAARAGHGLTVDEPFMANSVRLPWRDLFGVFHTDNVPFAYVLLRAWTGAFGESEFALRALSAAAYCGAVLVVALAGRTAQGPATGLTAAMLMATSAVGLAHAATARPYALLALIAAAAAAQTLAIFRVATPMPPRERLRRTTALAATHLLGLWTHPTYVFILLAGAGASLIIRKRLLTYDVVASSLAAVVWLALWAPVLWATIALEPTSWMRPPRPRDLEAAYRLLWGTGPGFMLIGALVVAGLSNVGRLRGALGTTAIRWVCLAAALAWLLPTAVSFWKPVFLPARTPVLLLPLTALAAAGALTAIASRIALVVLALLFSAAAAQRIAAGRAAGDPVPTRESVARVLERAGCGDTLLAAGLAHAPVEYYLRRLDAPSCLRFEQFPADMVDWTGTLADADARAAVEREASDLAARLAGQGHTVWLFTLREGMGAEASAILQAQIRETMPCDDALALGGAFFDGVVRCDP